MSRNCARAIRRASWGDRGRGHALWRMDECPVEGVRSRPRPATPGLAASALGLHADALLPRQRRRYRDGMACVRPGTTPNPDAMKFTLDVTLPARVLADSGDDVDD